MKSFLLLTVLVLSTCESYSTQNAEFVNSFELHDVVRRAATTTKKPAATTAKPTTTTKKPTTTTTKKPTTTTTTTKKPDWTISVPDMKTKLTTASQVFTTLGDVKEAGTYAEKFLKIKPERLVAALKGVSIAGAIAAAFIDIPDPETEKILNNMNTRFDTMVKKMDSQTSELKTYIDKKFLNTFILAPINTAEEGMNTYKKKPNAVTKAAFLEKIKMAKLPEVVNRILLNARDFLSNTMTNSRNNGSAVLEMSGVLLHSLNKAMSTEFYRNGVEFNGKLLEERLKTYDEYVTNTVQKYRKINDGVFEDLQGSFFPGFIVDDFVKPVLDESGGDICDKAEKIAKKLFISNISREYTVIVSDRPRVQQASSYFGFPNRMVAVESYNDKFVLIFMAMQDYVNKKKGYMAANERNAITLESQLVDYARNGKKYYQMAAFSLSQKYCLRKSNVNSFDEFTVQISVPTEFFGPVDTPVNFVVVF